MLKQPFNISLNFIKGGGNYPIAQTFGSGYSCPPSFINLSNNLSLQHSATQLFTDPLNLLFIL